MFVTCVRFELGTPDDMAAMLWFTWPPWVKWPKPWTSRDWLPKVTNMPRSMSFWLATRLSRTSKFLSYHCIFFREKSNKTTPLIFFYFAEINSIFVKSLLNKKYYHKKSLQKNAIWRDFSQPHCTPHVPCHWLWNHSPRHCSADDRLTRILRSSTYSKNLEISEIWGYLSRHFFLKFFKGIKTIKKC